MLAQDGFLHLCTPAQLDYVLSRHFAEKPAPPVAYNNDLTDEFSAFVLKMLAKKKTDRPSNFHEVLIELRKVKQIYKSVPEKAVEGE